MVSATWHANPGGVIERDDGRPPDFRETAIELLRLALGQRVRDPSVVDWDALFSMAVGERCGALAWNRSGPFIRESAPPGTVARWRALAMEADAFGRRQLQVLTELTASLSAAATEPVVLKGLPLAWRLYGDSGVRASVDIDIFVPLARRTSAERVLLEMAWEIVEGAAPWTQTLSRTVGDERFYLEVHSSLLDLNLLHLEAPAPQAHDMTLGDVHLPVHQDDILPAYLAAHAAKHMPVSLLYDIDFHTLWGSLTCEQRAGAFRQADAVGLTGYLAWMIRRSEAVVVAAAGDRSALTRLGVNSGGRSALHAVFRDLVLAPSPLAAAQAVAAWVWPPHLRGAPGTFVRRCVHRLRGPWSRYVRKRQTYTERGPWKRA